MTVEQFNEKERVNVIILANEMMLQFRVNCTEKKEYGYTVLTHSNRVNYIETKLDFICTTEMLQKALTILREEYNFKTSQMGIYYTISHYTYS